MSKVYRTAVTALDALNPAELAALIGEASARLKTQLDMPTDEPVTSGIDVSAITRRYLPRLPQMIEWGLVAPVKDTLYVRGIGEKPALLIDANNVAYEGETVSLNEWAKQVTGWKSINIYEWVVVKRAGRTLDELRHEYMDANGIS